LDSITFTVDTEGSKNDVIDWLRRCGGGARFA
jgi:hypothetical protein